MDNLEKNNLEDEEDEDKMYIRFYENECEIITKYLNGIVYKNPFDNIELMSLLGTKYTKLIYDLSCFPIDNLPNGITHLNISHPRFNYPIDSLPPSLIYLRIGGSKLVYAESDFNQTLDFLPSGLKILILEALENYTHPLDNLPPNLEYLYILNREYDLPLNNLPPSLKTVYKLDYSNGYDGIDYPDIDFLWNLSVS
jgi:hypothetical protein